MTSRLGGYVAGRVRVATTQTVNDTVSYVNKENDNLSFFSGRRVWRSNDATAIAAAADRLIGVQVNQIG